jgi:hypothetical protein
MNARSALFGLSSAVFIVTFAACASDEAGKKPADVNPAVRTTGSSSTEAPKPMPNESPKSIPKSLDTVSDSLNACLARIPKDSSSGARMMAENSCRRDETIRTGTARSNDMASAGAVEDSLQSCMGRIPKDATAGQRMLAEQSCKRDEAARK